MDATFVVLVALALGAALGFAIGRTRHLGAVTALTAERDTIRAERDDAAAARDSARAALSVAQSEAAVAVAAAEHERARSAERVADLEHSQEQLREAFQALSQQALEANGRQFLEMARDTLTTATTEAKGDLEQRRQAVEHLVAPVRDTLSKVEVQLQQLEVAREGAYRGLVAQVAEMRQTSADLRTETHSLVTALRKPHVRGRWGELHLRRAVELAGMVEHCDFAEQSTTATADGSVRPDLIVKLAGDRQIIVDAKVPLSAYLEAAEATDDAIREQRLKAHARQLRTHIDTLASKAYWQRLENTPEYVVLFVPGDSFLAAALEHDPELYEHAAIKQVLLTTPSTLIALLRTVALTWRQESLAENAKQVCELGRELYKRLSAMGGHVEKLGGALRRAVDSYNRTVGSLEQSVLPQARRFRDLQITEAELHALDPVEADVRTLTAAELLDSATESRQVLVLPAESLPPLDDELRRAAGLD